MCARENDGITVAPGAEGVERIEARFRGNGFSPHRHDTYAIGLTMTGVQTFSYRGEQRASMPGQVIVIHPDELHDGGAGTEEGLRYRMIYIAPERISAALGEGGEAALPFVAAPVVSDPRFRADLAEALSGLEDDLDGLKRDCLIADLAACLSRHADTAHRGARRGPARLDRERLAACADLLRDCALEPVGMERLEEAAGMDRFALARQFRSLYGTSPHRYLVMRRLDRAKALIRAGEPLAAAAAGSGFADQSHLTRHFRRAFGMAPGQWRRLSAVA